MAMTKLVPAAAPAFQVAAPSVLLKMPPFPFVPA
jgi:hypothetical protein